jgi:hypothetical protein
MLLQNRASLFFLVSFPMLLSLSWLAFEGCTPTPPQEQTTEMTQESNQDASNNTEGSPQENTAESTPETPVETTPQENTPETPVETTPQESTPETPAEDPTDAQTSNTPQSSDPAVVWQWLQQQNYRAWSRAPGHDTRQTSRAPHGGAVDIFVNPTVQAVLDAKQTVTEWPLGSIIMKDGYNGDTLHLVAYMEKRSDGWFWLEWDGQGKILFQGQPTLCTGCHSSGADFVRAFSFP